jgi:hypothetical protein
MVTNGTLYILFGIIFLLIAALPVLIFIMAKRTIPIKINYDFSDVSKTGFRIKIPEVNMTSPYIVKLALKQDIFESSYIYWNDVNSIRFNENKDILTVKLKNKKQFTLSKYHLAFYKFLKFSSNLSQSDKNYADTIFKSVKDCDICGIKAEYEGICLHCFELSWDKNSKDESEASKINYIKKVQLDYFSLEMNEDNQVNFFIEAEPFERNMNWKPLVTNAEVVEYYKKEYEE